MSLPPSDTGDDDRTLAAMWTKAVQEFEKSSGMPLNNHPLAKIFGHDLTSESIGKALDQCDAGLKKFRNRGQFVLNALTPLLDLVKAVVDPLGDVVENAGLPGGKIIFSAVGRLFEAIKGVSKRYDSLAEALIQMRGILARIQLLCGANAIGPLRKLCVQTLSELLAIISLFVKYCEVARSKQATKALAARIRDFWKSISGEDDSQPVFAELSRLIDESDKTVNAQTLALTTQIRNTQSANPL
ncbi:hypothetical protein DL93DRAFT_405480 [Clavulina sp. PMI_390]|nr:hypothetical protein DL93DRAFT_405480 [Clavulina sp. PMI_390]